MYIRTISVRIDDHEQCIEVVFSLSGNIEAVFTAESEHDQWNIQSADYLSPEQKLKANKKYRNAIKP